MPLLAPVVAFVLYQAYCSLFRGLNSGVLFLLYKADDRIHLGVDNLGVVRHVGRLLDGRAASRPAELVEDGDLILLIERMLRLRGLDTVRVNKVKGHADEALVRAGARDLDRLGNDGADEAADFGRWRVPWWIIDVRRNYAGVCARWRPVVLGLHRFFIAVARAVVNRDGVAGTSLGLMVWSVGCAPQRRRVVHVVRDRAFLPGPAGIWDEEWGVVAAAPITCHDIELWPYSVSMLLKWVAFLRTLHWPQGGADLGVGGVSYVELLILYEMWAGERLVLEKAVPRYRRAGR